MDVWGDRKERRGDRKERQGDILHPSLVYLKRGWIGCVQRRKGIEGRDLGEAYASLCKI